MFTSFAMYHYNFSIVNILSCSENVYQNYLHIRNLQQICRGINEIVGFCLLNLIKY